MVSISRSACLVSAGCQQQVAAFGNEQEQEAVDDSQQLTLIASDG